MSYIVRTGNLAGTPELREGWPTRRTVPLTVSGTTGDITMTAQILAPCNQKAAVIEGALP